jgi:hypothetical protein
LVLWAVSDLKSVPPGALLMDPNVSHRLTTDSLKGTHESESQRLTKRDSRGTVVQCSKSRESTNYNIPGPTTTYVMYRS